MADLSESVAEMPGCRTGKWTCRRGLAGRASAAGARRDAGADGVARASGSGGRRTISGMTIAEPCCPSSIARWRVTRSCWSACPMGSSTGSRIAKSMTLGRLAGHLAELAQWVRCHGHAVQSRSWPSPRPDGYHSPRLVAAVLAMFDTQRRGRARCARSARSDAELHGALVASSAAAKRCSPCPKRACCACSCFNHIVHHRGQLSVYLRHARRPAAIHLRSERRRTVLTLE